MCRNGGKNHPFTVSVLLKWCHNKDKYVYLGKFPRCPVTHCNGRAFHYLKVQLKDHTHQWRTVGAGFMVAVKTMFFEHEFTRAT